MCPYLNVPYVISVKTLSLFWVKRDTTTIVKKLSGIEIIPGLLKGIGAVFGLRP